MAINERLIGKPEYNGVKIDILHEKALYAYDIEEYEESLALLEEAKLLIAMDTSGSVRTFMAGATNDEIRGACHLKMNHLETADSLLHSALEKLGGQKITLTPYIYSGLAELSIRRGDTNLAKDYIDRAEPFLESSNNVELKLKLYSTYIEFYEQVGDDEKTNAYNLIYNDILKERYVIETQLADALLDNNTKANTRIDNFLSVLRYVGIALGILLCLLSGWF